MRRVGPLSVERVLLPLGLAALGYYAVSTASAKLYQRYWSRAFETEHSDGDASPSEASLLSPLGIKAPIARLQIPSIHLDVAVLEGTASSDLNRGVGHIEGTGPLGGSGNAGLAGHRDGFFRDLRSLSRGDRIIVTTSRGRSEYRVEETRVVLPRDVEVLEAARGPSLTLVTCYPFRFIGNAPERFIVRAGRVGPERPRA
jgi:sortase A